MGLIIAEPEEHVLGLKSRSLLIAFVIIIPPIFTEGLC